MTPSSKEYSLTSKSSILTKLLISLLLISTFRPNLASAAMNLPDGIENILGFVPRSSFECERDGYFGDIENDCRLFHLCQRNVLSNGQIEWRHWTYACGNQTMFNQLTLTCAFVDEAIPCKHASQFQYLNEVIHRPREPFLTDADVTSGFSYYSNRVMSDGARARAFEDSSLMAQLGGSIQGASMSSASSPELQVSFNELNSKFSSLIGQREATLDSSSRGHSLIEPAGIVISEQPIERFVVKFANANGQNDDNNLFSKPVISSRRESRTANIEENSSNQLEAVESMAPVASNQPFTSFSATSSIANNNNNNIYYADNNGPSNQHFFSDKMNNFESGTHRFNQAKQNQYQAQQKAPESFDFAISTTHTHGAESPVVSVLHNPGTKLTHLNQILQTGLPSNEVYSSGAPLPPPPSPQFQTETQSTTLPAISGNIDNVQDQSSQQNQSSRDLIQTPPQQLNTVAKNQTIQQEPMNTTPAGTKKELPAVTDGSTETSSTPTTQNTTATDQLVESDKARFAITPQINNHSSIIDAFNSNTTTSSIVLNTEIPFTEKQSITPVQKNNTEQVLNDVNKRDRLASGRVTITPKNNLQSIISSNKRQRHTSSVRSNHRTQQQQMNSGFASFESTRLSKRHQLPRGETPIVMRRQTDGDQVPTINATTTSLTAITTTLSPTTTSNTANLLIANNKNNSASTKPVATIQSNSLTGSLPSRSSSSLIAAPRFESLILASSRRRL